MFSKKIVAAAALLALAAAAQADVKLYGQVDMSVGSFKPITGAPNVKSVTAIESGSMSTGSYIGFSGSEDLGGGLKAGFVLESYIAADTGAASTTNFWSRASNVSLSGGFGKVALGQSDSTLYTMLTNYSPFGDSQVFAPNQVLTYGPSAQINAAGNLTNFMGQGTSWVNSLTYETPNMAGFSATVQYAAKENSATGADNKNSMGLGVNYAAGPLSAAFVYSSTGNNVVGATAAAYESRLNTTGLAASYNFGVATVSGEYTTTKNKNAVGTAGATSKFMQIGASIPVSTAGKVMLAYGERKLAANFPLAVNTPTPLLLTGNPEGKIKQYSLGYEHNLSKRTSVYVAATNLKVAPAILPNGKSNSYAFGIKHNF